MLTVRSREHVCDKANEDLWWRLHALTIGEGSDMQRFLTDPPSHFFYAKVVLFQMDGCPPPEEDPDTVLGWAALYAARMARVYADVYVHVQHRRAGFGRILAEEAAKIVDADGGRTMFSDVPFYRTVFPNWSPLTRYEAELWVRP